MTAITLAASPVCAQEAGSEADARYAALAEQQASRAGDPAFDYQLGLAAIDAGRYGEAIIALQRVLAVQPGNAPARADLARAYAMAGRDDAAAYLSAATVRGAGAGLDRAEALRRAQLALIDRDLPNAAHPAVWAPFVLVEN